MTASDSLISRLEAAEVGSRELDTQVAKAMGWTVHNARRNGLWVIPFGEYETCDPDAMFRLGDFTTSLDAALALAERTAPGKGWERLYAGLMNWRAHTPTGLQRLPLLVCAAILKAKEASQ
jgi:hypothetical protein